MKKIIFNCQISPRQFWLYISVTVKINSTKFDFSCPLRGNWKILLSPNNLPLPKQIDYLAKIWWIGWSAKISFLKGSWPSISLFGYVNKKS